MTRPVVGLTCYLETARWGAWDQPAALIPWGYVDGLQRAGARVVVLPPDDDGADVLDRLDALVISGGADVDPARYGEPAHPTTDVPRTSRDESELALYRGARERAMPVLGICRGLQVMAVAEGGRLEQHLPDVVGGTAHRDAPGTFNDHGARLSAGSLAARVVGAQEVTVNSSHHQAVADAGALTVTGWAHDGTVETAEDPGSGFVLGVQWHPEACEDPAVSDRLFRALVEAAAAYAAAR